MNMKIRPQLLRPTKSYANHTPPLKAGMLDCSLGVNPYGCPQAAVDALRQFDWTRLSDYPHDHSLTEALCRYWQGTGLTAEEITLTDASIAALYHINQLFAAPEAEVVGFAPSFTDMVVNVNMAGMRYVQVSLEGASCREDPEALLAAVSDRTVMLYLDNPNNPTGQTLPPETVEHLVAEAGKRGVCVLVDEAYGDFLPEDQSVLQCWGKYDNLIVTRTFSKGFGLAGLRAGYIVASPQVTACLARITNPYMMNAVSRTAAAAALTARGHGTRHTAEFAAAKAALRQAGGSAIRMLETNDAVPICTLCHRDPSVDLQQLLYDQGVLTVSGADFEGLGANTVRVRVPEQQSVSRLVDAVAAAAKE